MTMKRLMFMAPNPNDATSWWRVVGPLAHLDRRISKEWELVQCRNRDVSWSDFLFMDVVMLQRPFRSIHCQIIEMCKDLKIPVWVDWDDDLTCVPFSNPSHATFAGEEVAKNVEWIAKHATAITVSTHRLKEKFSILNPKTVLVPNAWDPRLSPPRKSHGADGKYIIWRGSRTHDEDLEAYIDEMHRISEKYTDWKWIFFGDPYWKIQKAIKRSAIIKGYSPHQYNAALASLHEQAPGIAIVPLTFNSFNESKSNIAWMEASFAGAATLAPNMREWRRDSVTRYGNPREFGDGLRLLINLQAESRAALAEASWVDVQQNFWMDRINQRRQDLLEELYREHSHNG